MKNGNLSMEASMRTNEKSSIDKIPQVPLKKHFRNKKNQNFHLIWFLKCACHSCDNSPGLGQKVDHPELGKLASTTSKLVELNT